MTEEKREEIIQDFIFEKRLRTDWDFALEYEDSKYGLYDAVDRIRRAVSELRELGYDVDEKYLIENI